MLSNQREFATADEIAGWIHCSPSEVSTRLRGARQAGEMVCVTTGAWVPADNGNVTPDAFIDDMMRHLGRNYYLGGPTAASRYGVAHQVIPTVFVMADGALLRRRAVGHNAQLWFVSQKDASRIPTRRSFAIGLSGHKCRYLVSTPEATILDLVARPLIRGSTTYANAAAQMIDWFELVDNEIRHASLIDPNELARVAEAYYSSRVRQRTGLLLDEMSEHTGVHFDTDPLRRTLPLNVRRIPFDYALDAYDLEDGPLKHNSRWNTTIWRHIEVDI